MQAKNLSLEAEVNSLKLKLESLKSPSQGSLDAGQVQKFELQIANLQEELEKKVNSTAAVANMKKMI